jgi:hypothetical protein
VSFSSKKVPTFSPFCFGENIFKTITFIGLNLYLIKIHINYTTGAHPTTTSYNASVVKIYSAMNSIARFYKKNSLTQNALAYYNGGVVVVS